MRRVMDREMNPSLAPNSSHVGLRAIGPAVLFVRAGLLLLRFEGSIRNQDFRGIYSRVGSTPVEPQAVSATDSPERICHAVDLACVWYWKPVLCLQRSAATCCLLKMYGFTAQLVIGVRQIPFRAHAWVELSGAIVNDKAYIRTMYSVVDEI